MKGLISDIYIYIFIYKILKGRNLKSPLLQPHALKVIVYKYKVKRVC